jgi:glutathione peroxidase
MRRSLASALTAAAVLAGADAASSADPSSGAYVLGYTMKTIDGADKPLADYKGKVVLIVNVASKCGLTPQYAGLEALYEKHAPQGLVVLGFPANNFGGQEPGTNDEIKAFCTGKYDVTFPMFAKISVKGDDIHPLYKSLTTQPAPIGGDVQWNFQKYLVDRSGNVVAMFGPKTMPDDAALTAKIEELLKQPS